MVGGTGFLGSEIALKLVNEGNSVKSLSRKISSTLKIDQTLGDISSPNSYLELISTWKPEVVVQAAWVTEQMNYRSSPLNKIYAESTVTLARHCFEFGTEHFITLGSCAEYGDPHGPCNASSTPVLALDPYGESKLWTLDQLRLLGSTQKRRITWARVFQPYGRNQDPARLIPFAAKKLASGEKISIKNPHTILDWITSRDVARAISYTLTNELPLVTDIGTSIGTTVVETLTKISELLGADSHLISTLEEIPAEKSPPDLVVSKDSPLLAAGWRPQDDLTSGLTWALSL